MYDLKVKKGFCDVFDVFSSVQSHSCVWLFATPWTAARQTFLSITNSWSLLKLTKLFMGFEFAVSGAEF